jgi:hypothetical protein
MVVGRENVSMLNAKIQHGGTETRRKTDLHLARRKAPVLILDRLDQSDCSGSTPRTVLVGRTNSGERIFRFEPRRLKFGPSR